MKEFRVTKAINDDTKSHAVRYSLSCKSTEY